MLCSHVAKRSVGQHNPATGLEEHGVELDLAFVAVLPGFGGNLAVLDGICAFSARFETEGYTSRGGSEYTCTSSGKTAAQAPSVIGPPLRCLAITCSSSCISPASSAIWVWATCTSILLIRSSLRGVRRPQRKAKNEAHHRQRVVSRLRMSHAKGAPRRPDAADPSHAARGDLTPSVRTRRPSAEPSPVMWCTGMRNWPRSRCNHGSRRRRMTRGSGTGALGERGWAGRDGSLG